MNILILAATEGEIAPFRSFVEQNFTSATVRATILVAGVGMLATAYSLTRHLAANKYHLVVQAGVGGSFNRNIQLGDVVFVHTDQYGDLGAEDHEEYIDIFDMGLLPADDAVHTGGRLPTPLLPVHDLLGLPRASGLTINTVSGNQVTIDRRWQKYGADVESMEGAALHYVCIREQQPFAQVRAISNYVIPRDKSQWRMKDAVINLNRWLIAFITSLDSKVSGMDT